MFMFMFKFTDAVTLRASAHCFAPRDSVHLDEAFQLVKYDRFVV